MRLSEETTLKIADYLILSSTNTLETGIYKGKAGHALSLFELAALIDNENIEQAAFNIIKEALLTRTQNINFKEGLSGLGHVLLYLIKYNFIDADFRELFGEKDDLILNSNNTDVDILPYLILRNDDYTDSRILNIICDIINFNIDFFYYKLDNGIWHYLQNKNDITSLLCDFYRKLYILREHDIISKINFTSKIEQFYRFVYSKINHLQLTPEGKLYLNYPKIRKVKIAFSKEELAVMDFPQLIRLCLLSARNKELVFDNPFKNIDDTNFENILYSSTKMKIENILQFVLYYITVHKQDTFKRVFNTFV